MYYESSSDEEEDELIRGLDREVSDLVNWDTAGTRSANEVVKVARDVGKAAEEAEEGGLRSGRGRKRVRNVVMDEEDEEEVKGSEGVGPTQQSRVKGLFD